MEMLKSHGTVIEIRNQTSCSVDQQHSPRTVVAAAIHHRLGIAEVFIELLDASRVANDRSGASVKNRFFLSNHSLSESFHHDSDIF